MFKYKKIWEALDVINQEDWKKIPFVFYSSQYISPIDSDFDRFCHKVYELSTFFSDKKLSLTPDKSAEFLFKLYDSNQKILDKEVEKIYGKFIKWNRK